MLLDEVLTFILEKYHQSIIHRHARVYIKTGQGVQKRCENATTRALTPSPVILICVASGAGELRSEDQFILGNV